MKKYTYDKKLAKIYAQLKFGCESEALLEETTKDVPVKKIKINSLDELKNIIKELEV